MASSSSSSRGGGAGGTDGGFQSVAGSRARRGSPPIELGDDAQW
jgi:hypothetical protein